jgi:hypothetical protein
LKEVTFKPGRNGNGRLLSIERPPRGKAERQEYMEFQHGM